MKVKQKFKISNKKFKTILNFHFIRDTISLEVMLMVSSTSERLRQIMNERNLKQTDILALAKPYCEEYNVKLGKSDLSQFVSGKVLPGQWKLTILGLALNVSEAWLMGLDVPMERKTAPVLIEEDERSKEFNELFHQLSDEQKETVIAVMRGFLGKQ